LNVNYEETHFEKSIEKQIDEFTFIATKWHTDKHFFKQIQVVSNKDEQPINLSTERVAKFSLEDFRAMLLLQNMQVQEVFGDYNLNEYNVDTSKRMIIVAKKN